MKMEENKIIKPITGIYPVTSAGVSLYFFSHIDLIICRKNGTTSDLFARKPFLNISYGNQSEQFNIENNFTNGMLDAVDKNMLPSVILASPCYGFLNNFVEEIIEITIKLNDLELLKPYHPLNMFYFPIIILLSNGIIYEETLNKLKHGFLYSNLPEKIINKVCDKILRGSILQGAFREEDLYYPYKKEAIKIALTKPELFEQIMQILNMNNFNISIQKNPKRIELENAMVNIATNAAALAFALDKNSYKLKRIDFQQALVPKNIEQSEFINELQRAVFVIGKKYNAFSESDQFETLWLPKKEQLLKRDNRYISNSLYSLKKMIRYNNFPDRLPTEEKSIIYPLKRIAQENNLLKELYLLEKLEKEILETINFAKNNVRNISFCF